MGSSRYKKLQVELLAVKWQDRCLQVSSPTRHLSTVACHLPPATCLLPPATGNDIPRQVRLAAQELLVAELRNLGGEGRAGLAQAWGEFIPKYGDPPFQVAKPHTLPLTLTPHTSHLTPHPSPLTLVSRARWLTAPSRPMAARRPSCSPWRRTRRTGAGWWWWCLGWSADFWQFTSQIIFKKICWEQDFNERILIDSVECVQTSI